MARVLMIVAQQGFRDEELFIPKEVLEKAGHEVKVASMLRSKATGSRGAVIQTDFGVHELNPDFFDCIVVVGGPGSPKLAENEEVLSFVSSAHKKGKITAAICLGPMTLAKAGILAGKNATVYPSSNGIQSLKQNGAHYLARNVVKDDKLVTADGPEAAEGFGNALAEMLKS